MKPAQQSPDFPDAFYRVTIKGICIRNGKVLMARDFSNENFPDGQWELPGGGLDFGEDFHTTLKREVQEEMGLTVSHIGENPVYVWPCEHGPGRGMDWFYTLVIVFQFDVVDLNFIPTEECKEIGFFSKEEIQANIGKLAVQIQPLVEHFELKDFA